MADNFKVTSLPECTGNTPAFPWYKQKLFFKTLRESQRKQKLSGAFDGHRWRFLNSRLDDFRDGYPLDAAGEEIFAPSQCKTSPVVFGQTGATCSSVKVKKKPPLTKEQVCFSKENPLKQTCCEHVEAVEAELRQHPLALYPHLESSMAPELFDEVLLVLDPDMYIQRTSARESGKQEHKDVCDPESTLQQENEGLELSVNEMPVESNKRNLYRTTFKDTQTSWDDEDQGVDVKGLRSPSQDENIRKVTKHFCDWVASLAGNTNNLTESTVLGLFVSSYDKKPSLIFPIEVVKPSNIPEEQRSSVKGQRRVLISDTLLKDSDLHEAGRRKPKHGAKLCKPRPPKEPLRDPLALEEDILFLEKPSAMDDELKQLHGAQALKQFIASRGLRMPRFLRAVVTEVDREKIGKGADKMASTSVQRGTNVQSV